MARRRNLWELDELGRRYGQRPSSFLGLAPDSWAAFQLDLACWTLGRWVEAKLAERDRQGRSRYRLQELLQEGRSGFRPLGGLVTRRMKVPESGIW
ncbi:MAG: hypothetical protein KatS3mg049_2091 [Caldilinea sp.]|nr:MAG: hypothetical protein KatS3mg049_2091 [Caldilinea sp.]